MTILPYVLADRDLLVHNTMKPGAYWLIQLTSDYSDNPWSPSSSDSRLLKGYIPNGLWIAVRANGRKNNAMGCHKEKESLLRNKTFGTMIILFKYLKGYKIWEIQLVCFGLIHLCLFLFFSCFLRKQNRYHQVKCIRKQTLGEFSSR